MRRKKPSRKEIVAFLIGLQEEVVRQSEELHGKLKGKPKRREELHYLRQLHYLGIRFQALVDVKYFVDPDTIPRSVAMSNTRKDGK